MQNPTTSNTGELSQEAHGRLVRGTEPFVFHCNFYNYWLQRTLLLDPDLGMADVIHDAAATSAHALLVGAFGEERDPETVRPFAQRVFAEHGFGTIDLSGLSADGGEVDVPVSHYGCCLSQAVDAAFEEPQSIFDAGFAAGVSAFLGGVEPTERRGVITACRSLGAERGKVRVEPSEPHAFVRAAGVGPHGSGDVPPPFADTSIDEESILAALATLDFSGNEEGLVPHFGVMLTNHFANFYNLISFEFVQRMESTGLLEGAEMLLTDAGYRCAFHTFGGIMTSDEWDAVVRPQIENELDWVHGMVACVNALGWGVWRVAELTEDRLVVRIYDDYESTGWLAHYGPSKRPVSFLALGGATGIMNLVAFGELESKPDFTLDLYARLFEHEGAFTGRQTKSIAMGDDYTEIVVER